MVLSRFFAARQALGVALAVFGLTLIAVGPVGAAATAQPQLISASDCASQSGQTAVQSVAISPGGTTVLHQELDGYFRAYGTISVFCLAPNGTNLGGIPDAQVKIAVNPSGPGISASMVSVAAQGGVATTSLDPSTPGNPVLVGPFSGTVSVVLSAPSNILPPGIALGAIGFKVQIVEAAWGGPLEGPGGFGLGPGSFGNVLAQTPELGSLALFGAGAAGMAGYALTRLRSRRRD